MNKALITALLLILSCTGIRQVKTTDCKFALISSTSPESPFRTTIQELPKLINAINAESPVFTIHTGNLIKGGDSRTGVNTNDIKKQFNETIKVFNSLRSVIYFTPADNDLYDSSFNLFRELTGRKEYFSFNYGNMHIAVINPVNTESEIQIDQMIWLERDLASYTGSQLFVISSIPALSNETNKKSRVISNGQLLHDTLSKNGVSAFISTSGTAFNFTKDGVNYINLPIGEISSKNNRDNNYYIIEFISGSVKATGKRLN